MATNEIPWVEKYRPSKFEDIVLDPINKQLFENILNNHYFPNLLFYGPPGTGKTTTIINLINKYQTLHNKKNKSTVIHLNASDERGIDVIRNQINQFVKSLNLFEEGLKFVILDEVDYMTKNAQLALKYLLQTSTNNVSFCLICNYITKIDESLKNEFMCIRFNQLPKNEVKKFIQTISSKENLELTEKNIDTMQNVYNTDIRSMINHMQLNQHLHLCIVNDDVLQNIHDVLTSSSKFNIDDAMSFLHQISIECNTDKKTMLQKYFNYIVRNYSDYVVPQFLNIVKITLHNCDDNLIMLRYFCFFLQKFYETQNKEIL